METLIQVSKLGRSFGHQIALLNVDFELHSGEIMALIGPNGSGKTTLLKTLAGFLKPSSGLVRVLGYDPFKDRSRVMAETRFAFAPPPLYDGLSAREHLRTLSSIRSNGAARPTRKDQDRVLMKVGLSSRADDPVGEFSFGMRQRLALAQALIPLPRLLVLDEPTEGLDPLAVLDLRDILKSLREEDGVTILLSSHLLIEVENLVDRLLVLEEGRTLFLGSPAELQESNRRLRLVVDSPRGTLDLLREKGYDPLGGGGDAVYLPGGALTLAEAMQLLSSHGLTLREFSEERPSLEQALLERIRGARRDTGVPSRRDRSRRPGAGFPRESGDDAGSI